MQTFMIRIMGLVLAAIWVVPALAAQQTSIASDFNSRTLAFQNQMPDEGSDAYERLQQVIELDVYEASLEEVLKTISEQAELKLMYRKALLPEELKFTYTNSQMSLYDALWDVLDGTGLRFAISENQQLVLLSMNEIVEEEEILQETVSGQVRDAESGELLPGVNVLVQGTSTGTATDLDGRFALTVENLDQTLIFSYIGYVMQEVSIDGRETIDINLQPEAIAGDEVVVIGYGVQRRSDMTGSVGSVSAEEIQSRPTTNIEQALSGRVAGADVAINSGRPGGTPDIRIRGTTSVSNTNDPLYVVDGVMLNMEQLQRGTHAINSIDPGSIESIEVLKDASATAIYGARGANGVVIITTKRGSPEGGRVSYDSYVSVGQVSNRIDLLNSEEFLMVEEIAYQNAAKFDPEGFAEGRYTDPLTKRNDPRLFDGSGNPLYDTDWQDVAFRNAITHNHNLSFAGGDQNTSYGLYLGYRDEEGVMHESWLNRYSGRFVIDTQINGWLTAGGSISYNNQTEKELQGWPMRMLYESIPIIPVRYPDGTWAGNEDYPGMEGGPNQRRVSEEDIWILETQNTVANVFTDISFSETLSLRTMAAANIVNQQVNRYSGRTIPFLSRNQEGIATISPLRRDNWQFENLLNYVNDIGNHSVNALLGQSIQTSESFSSSATTWGFMDDYFQFNNLGVGDNPRPSSSSASRYSLASVFSRVNYTYDQKYLFTVTGRVDGSSKFSADNRYAFFPSAAVGWMISEEDFMQNSQFISSLKLRASWGQTGNSEIPNYQGEAGLGNYTAIFNGSRNVGVGVQRLANPDLRWERNTQIDIGLEVGLFDNRVSLEADIYRRVSDDMLLSRPVPRSSGYATVTENIGSMENRGIELSLTTFNINTPNFFWSTNFNWSTNRNEVLRLHGGSDILTGGGVHGGGAGSIIREGYPVNSFMGYVHLGTWNTDEAEEAAQYNRLPGDIKYLDVNGDGAITPADQVIIGNGMPDGYGTIINNFSYRNFDLLVDIQFVYGNDVMWEARHSTEDRVGISNSLRTVLDAWTPDNQDTPIAQLRPTQAGYDTNNDTHRLEDGSFIRGRNLTLGYNFSPELLNQFSVRSLRVYASVQNFFTLTDFPGYDPEISTAGNEFSRGRAQYFEYPKARVFMLGMNLDF
jgi:TonB-dependent starch-binding outer membrane protein SusC